jgi:hypothetical protein
MDTDQSFPCYDGPDFKLEFMCSADLIYPETRVEHAPSRGLTVDMRQLQGKQRAPFRNPGLKQSFKAIRKQAIKHIRLPHITDQCLRFFRRSGARDV